LPRGHAHMQYFPVVHKCKWYFNWIIVAYMEHFSVLNFPGENVARYRIMQNEVQLGHFIFYGFIQ